jgi:hypothetical protein
LALYVERRLWVCIKMLLLQRQDSTLLCKELQLQVICLLHSKARRD